MKPHTPFNRIAALHLFAAALLTITPLAHSDGERSTASSTSTNQSPVVSFATPGLKTVTLQACNSAGCSNVTHTVTVLDPAPKILSIAGPTLLAVSSTPNTYSATLTGRSPFSYSWTLMRPDLSQLRATTPTIAWAPTAPGTYTLKLSAYSLYGSISATVQVLAQATVFADVPPNYWDIHDIETLYYKGITTGCSADSSGRPSFCPEQNVLRSELAVFLGRARHPAPFTPPTPTGVFADVPVSFWAAPWIELAYHEGITTGCSSTAGRPNFCPSTLVTRAEVAVFLERAIHSTTYTPPAATGIFADVPVSFWAAAWIEQLYRDAVTTGCSASGSLRYFCPTPPLTRAQLAAFLVRAFHLAQAPTATHFLADLCSATSCTYPSGLPLSFAVQLQGGVPTSYSYDWAGDGTYEETVAFPVSHIYTAAGTYTPRLRINFGTTSTVITHPFPIHILAASGLLAPPVSIAAAAVAFVPPAPTDPPGTPLRVAYAVSASPQAGIAGYAAYVNPGTGYVFVSLLQPNRSSATDQLLFPPGTAGVPRYLYLKPFTTQTFGTASLPIQLP